jgi:hypothetical protein
MLSLPDTLLLFALHDDKGTVHPSAFLALDHALRGASLAELRLRGCLKTWRDGTLELCGAETGDPFFDRVSFLLHRSLPTQPSVLDALTALETGLPELRKTVISRLEAAHILVSADRERVLLPGSQNHPMADGRLEQAARDALRQSIHESGSISPRLGTLLALADACGLIDVLFSDEDRATAYDLAALVRQRDAIAAVIQEATERTSGVWE